MRHYGAKRDDNEVEIVNALRAIGASVAHLSSKGIPDLLVSFKNKLYLIEVKKPKGKLTPDQIKFHENWKGEIHIVRTVQEAIEILNK
jgi:Holliday junction resolvase